MALLRPFYQGSLFTSSRSAFGRPPGWQPTSLHTTATDLQ